MPRFKSLKKPPLSEEVEKQLRASINAGFYKPGDKLPAERELVDQFEVSRVTVRDALKRLQQVGLVSTRRGVNAGAYVLEPSTRPFTLGIDNLIQMKRVNFGHLIEIRLYIEPDVARSAALCRTAEDVRRLKGLLDQAEEFAEVLPKKARLTNVMFHCEVAKIIGNSLIVYLCESITQVYSAMLIQLTQAKLDKKGVCKLISEHRGILETIDQRRSGDAYELTKNHLVETYHTYARILDDKENGAVKKRIMSFARL